MTIPPYKPAPGSSRRRLLYKVRSSTTCDGGTVYSVFSCVDDVEHHKHRKNPFDPKYVQAALSSFEAIGKNDQARVVTREEVEAASNNVHVRVELIKSMKDALVKHTAEAVKHCKGVQKRDRRKPQNMNEDNANTEEKVAQEIKHSARKTESFICQDDYVAYEERYSHYFNSMQLQSRKFGAINAETELEYRVQIETLSLGLNRVSKDLDSHMKDNPNFVMNEDLCFDLDKEVSESFQDVVHRLWPNGFLACSMTECEEEEYVDISSFKQFILPVRKELTLNDEDSESENEEMAQCMEEETKYQTCYSDSHEESVQTKFLVDDLSNTQPAIGEMHEQNLQDHHKVVLESVIQQNPDPASSRGERAMLHYANTHMKDSEANTFEDIDDPIEDFIDEIECLNSVKDTEVINLAINHSSESIEIVADSPDENIKSFVIKPFQSASTSSISMESEGFFCGNDGTGLENFEDVEHNSVDQIQDIADLIYYLTNDEVEKYLRIRKTLENKRCTWLVHDAEQLLHPNETTIDEEDARKCDQSSSNLSSIEIEKNIFRSALSRENLDLVEHFKHLQEDPSKIPGVLRFVPLPNEEEDYYSHDSGLDDVEYKCGTNANHLSYGESNYPNGVHINTCGDCWSKVPWSTEACPEENIQVKMGQSADDNQVHCPQQETSSFDGAILNDWNNLDMSCLNNQNQKRKDLEGVHRIQQYDSQYGSLINTIVSYNEKNKKVPSVLGNINEHSRTIGDLNKDFFCDNHFETPIDAANDDVGISEESSSHSACNGPKLSAIAVRQTEATVRCHQNSSSRSGDLNSSDTENEGSSIETIHQDTALDVLISDESIPTSQRIINKPDDAEGFLHQSEVTEDSLLRETKIEIPATSQETVPDRKRLRLDELIADAVNAECHSQQQNYIHCDLEPLSKNLAAGIASLCQQKNISCFQLQDLLTQSHTESVIIIDSSITIQRYLMALLSLAHQHNIGSFKEVNLQGFQMRLEGSSNGRLQDIVIKLVPIHAEKKH